MNLCAVMEAEAERLQRIAFEIRCASDQLGLAATDFNLQAARIELIRAWVPQFSGDALEELEELMGDRLLELRDEADRRDPAVAELERDADEIARVMVGVRRRADKAGPVAELSKGDPREDLRTAVERRIFELTGERQAVAFADEISDGRALPFGFHEPPGEVER